MSKTMDELGRILALAGFCTVGCTALMEGALQFETLKRDRVGDMIANPQRFAGHHVTVEGTVVDSFGIMGVGRYRLRDATDGTMIDVVTGKALPPTGTRAVVAGTFRQEFAIGAVQCNVIIADD